MTKDTAEILERIDRLSTKIDGMSVQIAKIEAEMVSQKELSSIKVKVAKLNVIWAVIAACIPIGITITIAIAT